MADVVAAPAFKKRSKNTALRKRPATPPVDDSESESTDDDTGVKIKRRKKEGLTTSVQLGTTDQDLSKSTKFTADRNQAIRQNEDATKSSRWYTDATLAQADGNVQRAGTGETTQDGNYKGTSNYDDFIRKNPDHQRHVGPVKAPTNVRAITVTDFAPDVCKDYKLTGFCGFGDSCKFLHARENYKQGWQLDKEWEMAGKADRKDSTKKDQTMSEEERMLKDIPFKCIICKEDYKRPVVTKCGHYFCEKCAMQRYMKEKKKSCANCGADTYGSFAVAKKLKDLLDKKQRREDEQAKEKTEHG